MKQVLPFIVAIPSCLRDFMLQNTRHGLTSRFFFAHSRLGKDSQSPYILQVSLYVSNRGCIVERSHSFVNVSFLSLNVFLKASYKR